VLVKDIDLAAQHAEAKVVRVLTLDVLCRRHEQLRGMLKVTKALDLFDL